MQALSDEQQIDAFEKRIDAGFAEMRAEFKSLRADMQVEFKAVRADMQVEFKAVRSETQVEFKAVRKETREDFREVRGEIGALHRTMMTMWLTMILGFAGILLQHHL